CAAAGAGPRGGALISFDAENASRAFSELSHTNQTIIWLRFVEMLEYDEIATQLGISEGAARQRVHRARRELSSRCEALEGTAAVCANSRSLVSLRDHTVDRDAK